MNSREIRDRFFEFFSQRNHTRVASSSLIPAQDPTLLFTNAGMNQFKDLFLATEKRSYNRAVTIQKCVRAGGKHNDLDNVGFTKRHLTFFEMMGNFSFGNYFKKEAIEFAWEFLTQHMNLSQDKLHVSVFESDDESYEIWNKGIGVPQERIHRLGAEDNFWQMGESGPCGPCTEIYIDRGELYGKGSFYDNLNGERFLEVWNLVFMQFDKKADGTQVPLAQTGVDTGMGLERLCAIMQNKDSVFQTDLFLPLIKALEELTGIEYNAQTPERKAAFHVLADHVRSSSFIIADGGIPSNEGRGYVLRKIIRRAALFSQKLNDLTLLPQLSRVLVKQMGDLYPELNERQNHIFEVLQSEVQKFGANLVRGQAFLHAYFEQTKSNKVVSGAQAFKLYDTYGFPLELTKVMAHEQQFTVDEKGFQELMDQQRMASGQKNESTTLPLGFDSSLSTEFTGYQELETPSVITALVKDDKVCTQLAEGQEGWVIVQRSPFFIVGGGQVPDQGLLRFGSRQAPISQVKYMGHAIAAQVKAPCALAVGDAVISSVDPVWRTNAMKNHTATHLLQSALMNVLGSHIKQSGSLVHPDYLRFDFLHHESPTAEQLQKVEDLVNEKIRENIPVITQYTTLEDANKRGVIAFFGDKYNPEKVRIVEVPGFSAELCGGTHVRATGDIGVFKITESTALAAGYRRIVALTGPRACELFAECFSTVREIGQHFKVKREQVKETVMQMHKELMNGQRQYNQLLKQMRTMQIPQWLSMQQVIAHIPYLFLSLDNLTHEELREIATQLAQRQPGLYVVVSRNNETTLLVAHQLSPTNKIIDLKGLIEYLKAHIKLRAGGNNITVQGGCDVLPAELDSLIKQWLAHQ